MSSSFWGWGCSEKSLWILIAFIDYTTQQKINPPYTIALTHSTSQDTPCISKASLRVLCVDPPLWLL